MSIHVQKSENKHPNKVLIGVNLKNLQKKHHQEKNLPMKQKGSLLLILDMNVSKMMVSSSDLSLKPSKIEVFKEQSGQNEFEKNSEAKMVMKREQLTLKQYTLFDNSYQHLKAFIDTYQTIEENSKIDPFYFMKASNILSAERRKTLCLWISAVAYRGIDPPVETPLFETIRLMDLFLSRYKKIKLNYRDLQAIAISCLCICADIEDTKYSKFKDLIPNVLDTFKEVLQSSSINKWSSLIRQTTSIDQTQPFKMLEANSDTFFTIFADAIGIKDEPFFFGKMLLELALLDHSFLRFRQSLIGFSCACLVFDFFLGGNVAALVDDFREYFEKNEVRVCGKELAQLTLRENIISLVEDKYQQDCNLNVSRFGFSLSKEKFQKRSSSLH
jgi:hypothetical protein